MTSVVLCPDRPSPAQRHRSRPARSRLSSTTSRRLFEVGGRGHGAATTLLSRSPPPVGASHVDYFALKAAARWDAGVRRHRCCPRCRCCRHHCRPRSDHPPAAAATVVIVVVGSLFGWLLSIYSSSGGHPRPVIRPSLTFMMGAILAPQKRESATASASPATGRLQ